VCSNPSATTITTKDQEHLKNKYQKKSTYVLEIKNIEQPKKLREHKSKELREKMRTTENKCKKPTM
jgi:hypothetical protein